MTSVHTVLAESIASVFRGRRDHLAVFSNGVPHPEKLRDGVTALHLERHIHGECCLGFYLLTHDSKCYLTAVDFDDHPNAPDPKWREKAERIYWELVKADLSPLVEISQSGSGCHIWLFFEQATDAWIPRAWWKALSERIGIPLVEVYPRQDRLAENDGKALGNLIRYPLWNKSRFVDPENEWQDVDPLQALQCARPTSVDELALLACELGLGKLQPPAAESDQTVNESPPQSVANLLSSEHSRLGRRWRGDVSGLNDKSKSGLAMAIACELVNERTPTPEIEAAVRWWCEHHGAVEKGRRDDWIERTVKKAYEFVHARRHDQATRTNPMPWRPFPVEVLPEPLRSFVSKGAQALGCDPVFIALPALACLAAAIGTTRRIRLKRTWSEPSVLWAAVVAESGTLKSPGFDLALEAIRERQADGLRRHDERMRDYEGELLEYEVKLKQWKRKGHKTGEPPPERPDEPIAERYICSDTTIEALAVLLAGARRGLLQARDELSGWFRGFDAYRQGRGGDIAQWLEMHRAGTLLVDRKTGAKRTIYVPHAAVSITGTVQPRTLARVLGREHFENGLAARLLLAMPPRKQKVWTEAELPDPVRRGFANAIDELLRLEHATGDDGQPTPIDIALTKVGRAAWIAFYNSFGEDQAATRGDLAAAFSKLEGYAARFALIMHLLRRASGDPSIGDEIDENSVHTGVTLARWFAYEAERAYQILGESDEGSAERKLIEFIERKNGVVSVRQVQTGCRWIETAEEARQELQTLVDRRLGRWENPCPGPKGGRPTEVFSLASAASICTTSAPESDSHGFADADNADGLDCESKVSTA